MNYTAQIKKNGLFKKWDALVAALAVVLLALTLAAAFAPKGEYAQISVDGRLTAVLPLEKTSEYKIEGRLTVKTDGGFVWVEDAACADKLCEKHAKINGKGQKIICLPQKIVVEIKGKGFTDAVI